MCARSSVSFFCLFQVVCDGVSACEQSGLDGRTSSYTIFALLSSVIGEVCTRHRRRVCLVLWSLLGARAPLLRLCRTASPCAVCTSLRAAWALVYCKSTWAEGKRIPFSSDCAR